MTKRPAPRAVSLAAAAFAVLFALVAGTFGRPAPGGDSAGGPQAAIASPAPSDSEPAIPARIARPPRKVLIGTVVSGYEVFSRPLAERLNKMDEFVGEITAEAGRQYPARRLDLVVLPEYFLAHPGDTLALKTVRLEEVESRIAACARRAACYLVVPLLLRETDRPNHFSNAALLMDRAGHQVGIYRKVHPVAAQGSDSLEGGLTPGDRFPVFDCDFGRVGIQICFDLHYADGWRALAQAGAEIVALPSASPETVRPAMYALRHGYYIVSATPRDHAAIYNPLGVIETQAVKEGAVVVDEIDLSYALLHWDAALDDGAALKRRFGDRIGFHYYQDQDAGIFWSNDPAMPIGRMIAAAGQSDYKVETQRIRRVQDKARGGPPLAP